MEKLGTRGIRAALAGACLLVSTLAVAQAPSPASEEPTPLARSNAKARRALEEDLERQRQERAQRRETSNIRVFKTKTGTPLFTNRLDKYRNRPGFTELNLKYERIQVDATDRRLKETDHYNASSIEHIVQRYANHWGLDKNLVFAIIKAESNFRQDAVSPAGACGLMQLMPGTAGEMGVDDIFDPAENIAGGTQYIAKMLKLFDNDLDLALAGYNAGPQTVINCGKQVPNIKETQDYVKRVRKYLSLFSGNVERPTFTKAKGNPRLKQPVVVASDKTLKTVHFHSGLTQPVEKVIDQHPDYYYVQFRGKMWSIPKNLVKEIT